MAKAAEAFRTIGEVSEVLDVPKHVLRFWEGKFPQVKPMKRGGGRRYYRPEDLQLLRGIRHLLHAEGYTIKGVQKILREQGIDQVKAAAEAAEAVAVQENQPKKRGRRAIVRNKTAATPPANRKASERRADAQLSDKLDVPSPAYIETAIRELEHVRSLLIEIGAGKASEPVTETRARADRR